MFELGAPEQTGWDVCASVPTECMARIPVHLGAYGPHKPPVNPLPDVD